MHHLLGDHPGFIRPGVTYVSQHVGKVLGGHGSAKRLHATGGVECLAFYGHRTGQTVLNDTNQTLASSCHEFRAIERGEQATANSVGRGAFFHGHGKGIQVAPWVEAAVNGGGVAHKIIGGDFLDGVFFHRRVLFGAVDNFGGDGAAVFVGGDCGDDGGIAGCVGAAAVGGDTARVGLADLGDESAGGDDVFLDAGDVHPTAIVAGCSVEGMEGEAADAQHPGDETGVVA